jgi:predicted nucleic acid-binding protein
VKELFTDTSYWVALINPRDSWRERALEASQSLGDTRLVTTQEVLSELAGFFSAFGAPTRQRVTSFIRHALSGSGIDVVPQSDATFRAGLELYGQRPDKQYSLIDCVSMETMRQRGMMEGLTHDQHFEQEGFVALLRR